MTRPADPFTDYDAAYVIGALSPAERRDYENHLGECDECTAAVGELAGLGGILAAVPTDRALALLDEPVPPAVPLPSDTLPRLAAHVRTHRRRRRLAVGGAALLAAAAVVAGVVVVQSPATQGRGTALLAFAQTVPTPITARAGILDTATGSTIRVECAYGDVPAGFPTEPVGYALTVTDRTGAITTAVTWRVGPGTEFAATAELPIDRADITDLAIVNSDVDQVILEWPR